MIINGKIHINSNKKVLDKIEKETSNINVKLYIAGGIVPYLLLNQDSNRLHSDIDLICDIKDMNTLRTLGQKYSVYQKQLDSLNFKNKDYGFEIFINNIKVGIYPFIIKNKIIYQYSYDAQTKTFKTKTIQVENITDYLMKYQSSDNKIYHTMSLEFIKMSKEKAGRKKDILDLQKIKETNFLRQDILNKIQMYKEKKVQ